MPKFIVLHSTKIEQNTIIERNRICVPFKDPLQYKDIENAMVLT
jgi:hypothetical protein